MILGIFGTSQQAEAATVIISDQASCEAQGGAIKTNKCFFSGSLTIPSGDSWTSTMFLAVHDLTVEGELYAPNGMDADKLTNKGTITTVNLISIGPNNFWVNDCGGKINLLPNGIINFDAGGTNHGVIKGDSTTAITTPLSSKTVVNSGIIQSSITLNKVSIQDVSSPCPKDKKAIIRDSSTTQEQNENSQIKETKITIPSTTFDISSDVQEVLIDSNSCCFLGKKQTLTAQGLFKTSYQIESIYDDSAVGTLNMWQDVGSEYVKTIEISVSHFNDRDSIKSSYELLTLLKKGVLTSEEISDAQFDDLISQAVKNEKAVMSIVGKEFEAYNIIVVEGTPGLTFMGLNIELDPSTFPEPQPTQQPTISQPTQQPTISEQQLESKQEQITEDDSSATNIAIGAFVLLGIPAIIIGLIIWKIKQRRKKNQISSKWKGV